MAPLSKQEAEALIRTLGGIGPVAERLGLPERIARQLLLSERVLPDWVHEALTAEEPTVDGDPLGEYLAKQGLDHLLTFAVRHGLLDHYERYGDGLVVRVENAHLLLDHQRALLYLRGIVRGYATGTGEWPVAELRRNA